MWGRLVESKFLVYMKNMFRAFATRSLFVHLFLFVQTEMGGGVGGQVRGNVRCTRCKKKVRHGRRHFSSYTKVVDQKLPRKALLPGKKRTRPSSSSSESQLLSPFPSLVLSRRRSLSLSLSHLCLSLSHCVSPSRFSILSASYCSPCGSSSSSSSSVWLSRGMHVCTVVAFPTCGIRQRDNTAACSRARTARDVLHTYTSARSFRESSFAGGSRDSVENGKSRPATAAGERPLPLTIVSGRKSRDEGRHPWTSEWVNSSSAIPLRCSGRVSRATWVPPRAVGTGRGAWRSRGVAVRGRRRRC